MTARVRRTFPPRPSIAEPRPYLLEAVRRFVREARACPGVCRIALLGSLATPKPIPKDADVLVTIEPIDDLARLARAGRRLMGTAQRINLGADVFLTDPEGRYIGRICFFRECHPRVRCLARNCGLRPHLNDDLQRVTLSREQVSSPPCELWPKVVRRTPLPEDVEQLLARLDAVRVTLAKSADRPVIEQLLQPYLCELSTYSGIGACDAGAYPHLHLYWREPDRRPFLISAGGRTAGFALVNAWPPSGRPVDRAMAEFYVVPGCRRAGIGARAAAAIIGSLPGAWEIGMSASHGAARAFWAHVVRQIPGAAPQWLAGDGKRWSGPILRFRAGPHGD